MSVRATWYAELVRRLEQVTTVGKVFEAESPDAEVQAVLATGQHALEVSVGPDTLDGEENNRESWRTTVDVVGILAPQLGEPAAAAAALCAEIYKAYALDELARQLAPPAGAPQAITSECEVYCGGCTLLQGAFHTYHTLVVRWRFVRGSPTTPA